MLTVIPVTWGDHINGQRLRQGGLFHYSSVLLINLSISLLKSGDNIIIIFCYKRDNNDVYCFNCIAQIQMFITTTRIHIISGISI